MADLLALDLVDKDLVTDQIVLTVGYDVENLKDPEIRRKYKGQIKTDSYGRKIPKHARGTVNLKRQTSSSKLITDALMDLHSRIVDKNLLVRRINITANNVVNEKTIEKVKAYEQLSLFSDYELEQREKKKRMLHYYEKRRYNKRSLK